MRLNLGCGHLNRQKGEIGLDTDITCRPEVCGNVGCLPFKDAVFDEVYACHVLEHVPDIVSVLNETRRILKENGKFIVRVPLFPTIGSIADPTHVRFFVPRTFDYFTEVGKLTGLREPFRMERIQIRDLTDDTQELLCEMVK